MASAIADDTEYSTEVCAISTFSTETEGDKQSRDANICHDDYADGECDWFALCKIAALPVLCTDSMVNAVPTLACRPTSSPAVRSMGHAGGRVECLSEHKTQLGCGCGLSCDNSSLWLVKQRSS